MRCTPCGNTPCVENGKYKGGKLASAHVAVHGCLANELLVYNVYYNEHSLRATIVGMTSVKMLTSIPTPQRSLSNSSRIKRKLAKPWANYLLVQQWWKSARKWL